MAWLGLTGWLAGSADNFLVLIVKVMTSPEILRTSDFLVSDQRPRSFNTATELRVRKVDHLDEFCCTAQPLNSVPVAMRCILPHEVLEPKPPDVTLGLKEMM